MTPTLHTTRLTLGPATQSHAEAFIAFCATEESRFIGGPAERRDAWEGVAIAAGLWTLRGFGPFWLTETATGTPVGRAGIYYPDWRAEPELAWTIYPAHQRKGYGFEAATAARDWAYATHDFAALVSLIDADNAASIKLAQKLGARNEGPHTPNGGHDVYRWRHPKAVQQ
jgi:RimJ/RimL family protein N-acetyltransferase